MSRERITQKDLESLIKQINELTNSPLTYSTKNDDGSYKCSNIGHYHLSYAYGGVNIHRIVNDGGGITTPLGGGYYTKRELYIKLTSFISGLYTAKQLDTESKKEN